MLTSQLKADFQYCENIIKRHSKSFYYAFSGLPAEKSRAVYAIYAFCRIADDSVDENGTAEAKMSALNQLHSELDLFNQGEEPDHPMWRALRHVFDQFELDIQPFYDQLIGQKMDVRFSSPENLAELEEYSYFVAGSVGLMLLPIIASKNHNHLCQAAIELGIAMQITNILRDVGEDYFNINRIYLPEQERIRFGYGEEKLANMVIDDTFVALWEHLASRAEHLYDAFSDHLDQFDEDSQIPVAISANVYRGILDVIRENKYDCLSKRNYVPKEQMEQMRS